MAGLGEPLTALDEAQRLGLLTSDAPTAARAIAFDHPLTRRCRLPRARPRPACVAACRRRGAGRPAGVALRHRALAATGPDPALAAELEAFAAGEVLRNAWESASEHYLAAARLTPAGAERERLEIESADALLGAALTPAARARLGRRAEPGAETTADARLLTVLAYVALQEQRLDEAERLLALAWERDDADDLTRRKIAERRTVLALARLRPDEALTWARRVAPHVPAGPERELARWPEALAHAAAGDQRAALAVMDQALTVGETVVSDFGLRAMRGRFRLAVDDVTGALEDLRTAAAAESRLGSESFKAAVHAWLAEALQAAGAWEGAALEVEQALALVALADNSVTRMEAHRVAIVLAVACGELAAAEQQLRLLRDSDANPRHDAIVAAASATIATAHGQPERVLEELEPFATGELAEAHVVIAEGRIPWLRADALIRLGRLDEADALLRREQARAAEQVARSPQVVLGAPARAAGGGPRRPRRGRAGVRGRARHGARRSRCRTSWRSRSSTAAASCAVRVSASEGAALLALARDRFAALGAAPALEQCERELAASGLTPARRADADRSALTARERAVAQLAADGLTNRAIAAELMVSVKTVEVHLSRVFAKLGIAARTELADHL